MFTGIIERTGRIVSLRDHGGVQRLTVAAPGIAGRLKEGDSLAVSGVCLTALDIDPEYFHADLAAETLSKTSLRSFIPGSLVNLELPMQAGAPLGGHIVQGHIDGTGELIALEPVAPGQPETDWWVTIRVPEALRQYMVPKGSVAIEGVSLTIAAVSDDTIRIAILPLTYVRTNLHSLKPGSPVNIEADVLMKLAVRRTETENQTEFELTETWLVANGY